MRRTPTDITQNDAIAAAAAAAGPLIKHLGDDLLVLATSTMTDRQVGRR